MSHAQDPVETRKGYFKIFRYLCVLTVLEVVFVMLPIPKLIVTLLVVVASCTKAALVGYYFMHLKSETTWLRTVACLPIVMFGYLAVLGPDANQRTFKEYINQPPRILPSHGEEAHHEGAAHEEQEAAGLPAGVKVREIVVGPGHEPVVESTAKDEANEWGAPAAAPTTPTSAPAAGAAPTAATPPAASGGGSVDEFR